MIKIQVIIGSTRPNRFGDKVGSWFYDIAQKRDDLKVELIDLKEVNLPLLDEPIPPAMGQYQQQHTKDWAKRIAPADGYVFITGEYNFGIPAALKNAIDFLGREWNNKAVGFVSYGIDKGVRAVSQLREVAGYAQWADVQTAVGISIFDDVDANRIFKPNKRLEERANMLLDQLEAWAQAMKTVRGKENTYEAA